MVSDACEGKRTSTLKKRDEHWALGYAASSAVVQPRKAVIKSAASAALLEGVWSRGAVTAQSPDGPNHDYKSLSNRIKDLGIAIRHPRGHYVKTAGFRNGLEGLAAMNTRTK